MSNVELVQQALAAVRTGDEEAQARLVSPDFVWHLPGSGKLGGDVHGAAAWAQKLGSLLGAGLQPQLLGMMEGGDHVVALQHNRASSGGHELDVQVVNLFTVRDGQVARLDTFCGDQPHAEAFWEAVLP